MKFNIFIIKQEKYNKKKIKEQSKKSKNTERKKATKRKKRKYERTINKDKRQKLK